MVSRNDFGEPLYTEPIKASSKIDEGSATYLAESRHDSWSDFFPYYIAMYKGLTSNTAAVQMKYLHYTVPINGAFAYGVDGNYRNHQPVVSPNNVLEDEIFFSALMYSAIVAVQIGNNPAVYYPGL
jgi:hypothetical protein